MRHFAVVLVLAALAGIAQAAGPLPVHLPQGVYREDDPAAAAMRPPSGNPFDYRRYLDAVIQQSPDNVAALVARAYLLKNSGQVKRARRDWERAAAAATPGSPQERHLQWSRGWGHYDLGEYEDAFEDWRRALDAHGGRPFWVPHTMALLYWTTGDRDTAVAWYDAAVATNGDWATEDGFEARTDSWRPQQRERMREAFAAWKQRRAALATH